MDPMGDLSHSEYTGEKVLAQYKMHDTFMETREEAGVQQVRVKITLYCTVLYCTVLYCTVMYCTDLHLQVCLLYGLLARQNWVAFAVPGLATLAMLLWRATRWGAR